MDLLNDFAFRVPMVVITEILGLPSDTAAVGHPPELFTILKMGGDGSQDGNPERESRYVVYPDPPLGDEELGLLRQMAPRIHFVTPTMLPLIRHQIANQ